jgi:hypothetical protein
MDYSLSVAAVLGSSESFRRETPANNRGEIP